MKKVLITIFAALLTAVIAGVIIYTVKANIETPDNGEKEKENWPGDAINTTAVPDKSITENKIRCPFGDTYSKEQDFANFDYITFDLDISPAGASSSYHTDGMKFYMSYVEEGTESNIAFATFYLLPTGDGCYYLGAKSSSPNLADGARISSTYAVYDHLTFIVEIGKTEGELSSVTTYAYANGNFVAKVTKELTGNLSFTRFFIGKSKETGAFAEGCGISYKNFVAYTYNAGGEKALALKTLVDSGKPLYRETSNVVVYNASYETPDSMISYVKVNDEKYTLPGQAIDRLATLTSGDVITVGGRNLMGITIPEGVESFTVNLLNNGKFSLSAESDLWYVKEDNLYRFQKKNLTVTDDCSSSEFGYSHVLNGDKGTSSTTSLGFAHNNSAKSTNIKVTYVNAAYVRIHYNDANGLEKALAGDTGVPAYAHMEREGDLAWRAHYVYNEKTDLKNVKYLTLDFDFGTDAYAYTYETDGETKYVTAKDDGEFTRKTGLTEYDSRDLAFPLSADGSLKLTPVFLSSKTDEATSAAFSPYGSNANWELKNLLSLVVTKSKGEWIIKPNTSGAQGTKLSGEVGVFDHVTFVFEIENEDGKIKVYPHIYVNGEHLASLSAVSQSENSKYNHFYQMKISFGKDLWIDKKDVTLDTPAFKMFDRYSFAFDNMILTYYDSEDLDRTTLDELLPENAPLYTMTGVVYDENYVTPGAKKDETDN